MTGYAMANHGQHLEFSTDVHKLFGWSLMSAGFVRIVEVCFVLRDAPSDNARPRAFQHLPPYLLVLSGLTFLSATEEQMQWVAGSGMDSTTYANILFSGAFAIYLVGNALLELYQFQARTKSTAHAIGLTSASSGNDDVEESAGAGPRHRPATSPPPGEGVFGLAVPTALSTLFGSITSAIRSLHNVTAGADARNVRGQTLAGDREMAQYESLPMMNRDSTDHQDLPSRTMSGAVRTIDNAAGPSAAGPSPTAVPAAGTRESRNGRVEAGKGADVRRPGVLGYSDETVFDVGDFDETDDGGDGYWHDNLEAGHADDDPLTGLRRQRPENYVADGDEDEGPGPGYGGSGRRGTGSPRPATTHGSGPTAAAAHRTARVIDS